LLSRDILKQFEFDDLDGLEGDEKRNTTWEGKN
jgi:hypothetical protein